MKIKQNVASVFTSLKVAIYIRVSTHWQIDKDSLQVQKRELIAYCQMVLGIQDFVIFEDPGYSAKNTNRPEYQHMMNRLRTGEFSHLLVWKIDRISRNLLDFAQMYDELKECGVTFVSKNEQFDTSSAIGEAMLKIILVFAELERNMTSERVTAVMLSRANNGQWNGGRIPYGYDYDSVSKTFSINSYEAKVVHSIYELYEKFQSTLYVARKLNESNVTTRNGKSWSTTTIHKILTNPFYIGSYVYNVYTDGKATTKRNEDEWIVIENHHEPIISAILFDRIQGALKRNKRGGNEQNHSFMRTNIHVFGGLLKCGICGSVMSATLDRVRADGWRPSLYGCSKRRNGSGKCTNKYITDATIGPFIFNYVANIIRANKMMTNEVSLKKLEKQLLRGKVFNNVSGICEKGLMELRSVLKSGNDENLFKPSLLLNDESSEISERDVLEERLRKKRIALNRLKAVYLYGDEETPEQEFITERHKIICDIEELEEKLSKLVSDSDDNEVTNEFIQKAGYFLMVENLLSERYIEYEKYIKTIDQTIPKQFVNSIINCIHVTDGFVTKIEFKNGIVHEFTYKQNLKETTENGVSELLKHGGALCELCGQRVLTHHSCNCSEVSVGNKIYKRIKFGHGNYETDDFCHNCAVERGCYHHCNCDVEPCPVCGNQIIACDCEIEFIAQNS